MLSLTEKNILFTPRFGGVCRKSAPVGPMTLKGVFAIAARSGIPR
jgi:hypothetical protein